MVRYNSNRSIDYAAACMILAVNRAEETTTVFLIAGGVCLARMCALAYEKRDPGMGFQYPILDNDHPMHRINAGLVTPSRFEFNGIREQFGIVRVDHFPTAGRRHETSDPSTRAFGAGRRQLPMNCWRRRILHPLVERCRFLRQEPRPARGTEQLNAGMPHLFVMADEALVTRRAFDREQTFHGYFTSAGVSPGTRSSSAQVEIVELHARNDFRRDFRAGRERRVAGPRRIDDDTPAPFRGREAEPRTLIGDYVDRSQRSTNRGPHQHKYKPPTPLPVRGIR